MLAYKAFTGNVRPKVHQWTEEDLEKLNSNLMAKVYYNGEFTIWGVFGGEK